MGAVYGVQRVAMWNAQPSTPKRAAKRGHDDTAAAGQNGVLALKAHAHWNGDKKKNIDHIKCFKCGKYGHYSDKCPSS